MLDNDVPKGTGRFLTDKFFVSGHKTKTNLNRLDDEWVVLSLYNIRTCWKHCLYTVFAVLQYYYSLGNSLRRLARWQKTNLIKKAFIQHLVRQTTRQINFKNRLCNKINNEFWIRRYCLGQKNNFSTTENYFSFFNLSKTFPFHCIIKPRHVLWLLLCNVCT